MSAFVTNEFHAKPGRGQDVLALLLKLALRVLVAQGVDTSGSNATKTTLTMWSGLRSGKLGRTGTII